MKPAAFLSALVLSALALPAVSQEIEFKENLKGETYKGMALDPHRVRLSPVEYRKILRNDFSKVSIAEFNPSTQNRLLITTAPQLRADVSYIPGKEENNPVTRFNGYIEGRLNNGLSTLFDNVQLQPNVKIGAQMHANLTGFARWVAFGINRAVGKPLVSVPRYPYFFLPDERAEFKDRQDSLAEAHRRQLTQLNNQLARVGFLNDEAQATLQAAQASLNSNLIKQSAAAPGTPARTQADLAVAKDQLEINRLTDSLDAYANRTQALNLRINRLPKVQAKATETLHMQIPFSVRRHWWVTFDVSANGQNFYLFEDKPAAGVAFNKEPFVGTTTAVRFNGIKFAKEWNWFGSLTLKRGFDNNAIDLDPYKFKANETYSAKTTATTANGTNSSDQTYAFTRDVEAYERSRFQTFRYHEIAFQYILFSEKRTWGLDLQTGNRWRQEEGRFTRSAQSVAVGIIASGLNRSDNNARISGELLVTFRDLANVFRTTDTPSEWYNRRLITVRVGIPFPSQK